MRVVRNLLVRLHPYTDKGSQIRLRKLRRLPGRVNVNELKAVGTSFTWRQRHDRRAGVTIESLDLVNMGKAG